MKILLDNCLHYDTKALLAGHEVLHARDVGWQKLANGDLTAAAGKQFDVLITVDKKMRYEQNLAKLPISIIELNTKFGRLHELKAIAPFFEEALIRAKTEHFVVLHSDGRIEIIA